MSNEHTDSVATAAGKSAVVATAWLGSVALADVQAVIGIISGLAVLVYTVINIYIAWRDKLRSK
jgi:hypothetical protein